MKVEVLWEPCHYLKDPLNVHKQQHQQVFAKVEVLWEPCHNLKVPLNVHEQQQ